MPKYVFNNFRKEQPVWEEDVYSFFRANDVRSFHRLLPGYKPTPLTGLPNLAKKLGVGSIHLKDESQRFDLKAFKVLGASYAVFRFLKEQWEKERDSLFDVAEFLSDGNSGDFAKRFRFCTATDGNHGRAVAWVARCMHQSAIIYMPHGSSAARIENIEAEGAKVIVVNGNYDDAVKKAAIDADQNDYHVISDTAYTGYTIIPRFIMAGYLTMFDEIYESIAHAKTDDNFDIVFLQAGVGSFAAAATWYLVNRFGNDRPRIVLVEPTEAACFYESFLEAKGEPVTSTGNFKTIMAGLNCGTVSPAAWLILRDGIDLSLTIPDEYAVKAMKTFYYPTSGDRRIISGESGASGMAALLALLGNNNLHEAKGRLSVNRESRILIINTEGDTDPEIFHRLIEK